MTRPGTSLSSQGISIDHPLQQAFVFLTRPVKRCISNSFQWFRINCVMPLHRKGMDLSRAEYWQLGHCKNHWFPILLMVLAFIGAFIFPSHAYLILTACRTSLICWRFSIGSRIIIQMGTHPRYTHFHEILWISQPLHEIITWASRRRSLKSMRCYLWGYILTK